MDPRRTLAALFTTLFVAAALSPLAFASTEPTFNGDVVINGAFRDARPVGHPFKANDPQTTFAAFDWVQEATKDNAATTEVDETTAGTWSLGETGGITVTKTGGPGDVGVQQYFNGSFATAREMRFFGAAVTANASTPGTYLSLQIRYQDAAGARFAASKSILLTSTPASYRFSAADFGLDASAAMDLVSVRLLTSGLEKPVTIQRVSVYATNGVEARNLHVLPGGDDVVTPAGVTSVVSPGRDGKYTFVVGMAADDGAFLPTLDAWGCLYTIEQAFADRGYPANGPDGMCQDAYVKTDSPAITKTRVGDAWRIDIASSAVSAPDTAVSGFAFFATVKVDSSYDVETPGAQSEFKSGYYHAARVAADLAGAGVSRESFGPTPLLFDGDSNGVPDAAEVPEADGYSVIITPQGATATPIFAIQTPNTAYEYVFDIEVYDYTSGTGVAMPINTGLAFGLFDLDGGVNGGAFDAKPFWNANPSENASAIAQLDATTVRVTVPGEAVPANGGFSAWAFYDVHKGHRTPATAPFFGPSTTAFDFYSAARTSVKQFPVADALRSAMTPIFADAGSLTGDATIVIRMDPETDELTPLEGTLVAGDGGDESIAFEYALLGPSGVITPTNGHALAIYDAAGILSDDLSPGSRFLEHAEFVAVGAPTDDGWFRVEVPLSAFADAKGPVGAWAYADTVVQPDDTLVSRSGYYNLLKPALASVSTSAAETALYEPTPIVILDTQLGIPQGLSATLAGLGSGILSVTNPLANPGFEASLVVEGYSAEAGGTMTSPPWFFRLDDMGTAQPTNPRSTHEVVAGKGRQGDSALEIRWSPQDTGKGLMLGQLLGNEAGTDALVWKGATATSFDVRTLSSQDVKFVASLRYFDPADETVKFASSEVRVEPTSGWTRIRLPMTLPSDAHLLGFYLQPWALNAAVFYVDNVVVEGAQTALGDARTDLTDGFAMVIEPQDMLGAAQQRVTGVDGDYYLYNVTAVDYTQGAPRAFETLGVGKTFGFRTDALQMEMGTTLVPRGSSTTFVAAVPVDEMPATPAAPWAWVRAGEAYNPLGQDIAMQPASGYYSPLKNALAGSSVADQLDYAGTPVAFLDQVARELAAQQSIRLAPTAGGYQVFVAADSPFVETTTLTVSQPGMPDRTYQVDLTRAIGDVVPGLELTSLEAANATLTTSDTLFTRGATLVAGSPIPDFEVCRVAQPGCLGIGILSGEDLLFRSLSTSPAGETLTLVWDFGDDTPPVTTTSAETTKRFTTPGTFTVNLTAQTASGKSASILKQVSVANRAPSITGIDVAPSEVFVDSLVSLQARASDPDGGTLSYAWTVDGVAVSGPTGRILRLTPDVLGETTGLPALEERTYAVGVSVDDGQGLLTTATTSFLVKDRPTLVSAPNATVDGYPNATYALPGETLLVSVVVSDADDVIDSVSLDVAGPSALSSTVLALTSAQPGVWTGALAVDEIGAYTLSAIATPVGEAATIGAPVAFEVRANLPPVVTVTGPATANVGETTTYTVSAVDPDARGVLFVDLSADGATLDGNGFGVDSAAFNATFTQMGDVTLTARAADAVGAIESETETLVVVDDVVFVTLEMLDAPETAVEGYRVKVTVTDVLGAPIGGVDVLVEDYFEPLPAALRKQTVTTEADGTKVFRVDPEAGLLGLPLSHRLVATVTAPSHADAPVQDDETASGELSFRNGAEPFAGLPLP